MESFGFNFQARTRVQLNQTLKGLCYKGQLSEAVGLLCHTGLQADPCTYALMLQECIFWKNYQQGRTIHAQMVMAGHVPDDYLKIKLLILYSKYGDFRTVHVLFNKLIHRSLVSWNALVSGYVQKGHGEVGLGLYYRMREAGSRPDQYTLASVFKACGALAMLGHGERAHGMAVKCRLTGNVVVSSSLMDMYFKCSSICSGRKVFDELTSRNVVTWTSLMSGYGQNGRAVQVLESFRRMKDEGFRPNSVTFLVVLSACARRGLVGEGWGCFLSMSRSYGIQPGGPHYAAVVDLLGRAGRLEEAYEFVQSSPCKYHSNLWSSMLNACTIHGDVEIFKSATKKLFEVEMGDAEKCVLLSNAYATFGFWENVYEIRGMMRSSGVGKEPSHSKVEVHGEINLFSMGEAYHEKYDEICDTIFRLTCILKDMSHSLHIIDAISLI